MSRRIGVSVESYSGYTYAQRPIAFVWNGLRYQIQRILQQWRTPEGPGFKVITSDGMQCALTYDEATDTWTLHVPDIGRAESLPPSGDASTGKAGIR